MPSISRARLPNPSTKSAKGTPNTPGLLSEIPCDHCDPDTGDPVSKFHLENTEETKVTIATQASRLPTMTFCELWDEAWEERGILV